MAVRGASMRDDDRKSGEHDPARLIKAIALHRDRDAFAMLFAYYAPRIKAVLMRQGASAELAEDLAQEALLSVWRKADYFEASRASASAWIFAIARNLRIDALRRDQRARKSAHYNVFEPEAPETPDSVVAARESDAHVRTALAQLSKDHVKVVRLSFFEGKAHREIAEVLNIPLGTVKSRLRLAMGRLRELLGELK